MSAFFLVRLKASYRYIYHDDRDIVVTAPRRVVAAFSRKEAAEAFAATHLPLWQNPFRRDYFDFYAATITFANNDDDEDIEIPYDDFLSQLSAANIPLPRLAPGSGQEKEQLAAWWDETAPALTDAQKTLLWQILDPVPLETVTVEAGL